MHIESNFNSDFIMERDCLNVDIEKDEQGNWYFSYKAVHGFVVGYFDSKEEAMLIDRTIHPSKAGTIRFSLNADLSQGKIHIENHESKEATSVSFHVDTDNLILYRRS